MAVASPSSALCTSLALALKDEATSLLSDEVLRIIQSLQSELDHTSWRIREAEQIAEQRLVAAEEQNVQFGEACDRNQEIACKVRRFEHSADEEAQHRKMLQQRLEMTQEEVIEARARQARSVHGEKNARIREELQRLRKQFSEAQMEGKNLRTRIAEAEESRRKREERTVATVRDADIRRQSQGHVRASRMSEAKQMSVKAMQERKERDTKMHAEKHSQLSQQKELLESEIENVRKQNTSLEARMEVLRNRNRQLEAQQRKQQAAIQEQEDALVAELRKHAQRKQVLQSLFRLPPEAPPAWNALDDTGDYAVSSSAATPTGSPSISTVASTARIGSSTVTLGAAHSAGGISEAGITSEPSLSQLAAHVIAVRSAETLIPSPSADTADPEQRSADLAPSS
jgi:hypothetical protein